MKELNQSDFIAAFENFSNLRARMIEEEWGNQDPNATDDLTCFNLMDAEISKITNTLALNFEGIEIKIWLMLICNLKSGEDEMHALKRNIDHFDIHFEKFDADVRLIISAIQSLRDNQFRGY